jgi:CHAT domain-containing protein
MSWRSAVLFAFLCPLALVGGSGGFACFHRNSSISTRAKLAETLGPCRFIEGRLTGGFSYARFDPAHSGPQISKDRRMALRKLSREVSGSTPEAIADRALLKLLDGDSRQAVQMLETASAAKPGSAALLSDLAAVYLADARINNDPYSRVKALEAAENAVTIDSKLQEARFNRALALESLFLRNQTKSAWDEYLKRDEKSDWAREARDHKKAADVPDAASRWALQERRLDEAVARNDQATVDQIVRDFPQASREYAEERLLGEWAAAALAKRIPEAQQKLAIARSIGTALVQSNGERMVVATNETIARAISSREQGRLARLAQGHLSYQKGLESYSQGRFTEARDHFVRASTLLNGEESLFAQWGTFRLAVSEMQLFHYGRSLALLHRLGRGNAQSLRGRALWVEGLIYMFQGKPAEALAAYRRALHDFAAIRESENMTVVSSLIAESLAILGDISGAWKFHFEALSSAGDLRNTTRRQQVLEEAGATSLQAERPATALFLLQEAFGGTSSPTVVEVYCLRRKALALSGLKKLKEAKEDIRLAKSLLPRLLDENARMSLLGDLLAAEGEILTSENPAAGIKSLTEAIRIYNRTDYPLEFALIYAQRARAYLAMDDLKLAENDFQQAIRLIRTRRKTVADLSLRASYLEEFRTVFDDMVELQIRVGRKDRAFDWAESSRAQILRELLLVGRGERTMESSTVSALQRNLTEDVAIVEYHVLPDRLAIWVLRRKSLDLSVVEVSSQALRALATHFRHEVLSPSSALRQDAESQRLYDLLIGTIQSAIKGAAALVLVPDRALSSLPFAALPDTASGKYLVEQYALSTAPSANVYSESLKRERHLGVTSAVRVMAMGDPVFETSSLYGLPRLAQAAQEAKEVAALYPKSSLLLGAEATTERFLSALSHFDIVHFSGHAVAGSSPSLSAFLVFAPSKGTSGILYARELYGARRACARLAVLSACSGLAGDGVSGEGVESLARPFLAIGVPSVIASLWVVNDASAREFFAEFYRSLRSGASAAEALRHAQLLSLSSSEKAIASPGLWAGFQLIGAGTTNMKRGRAL